MGAKEIGHGLAEQEAETSEFGRGLAYCLGLFLAHADRFTCDKLIDDKLRINGLATIWFSEASDHLYELGIDEAPESLRERLKSFRDKCLQWGHGLGFNSCAADVESAIGEAKSLLFLLDQCNGVTAIEARWK